MTQVPLLLASAFCFLCVFVAVSLVQTFGRSLLVGVALAAWLGVTGTLATLGFFEQWLAFPPRILFAIAPALAAAIALGLNPRVLRTAKSIPHSKILLLQTFRVGVEILIYLLAAQHVMPEIMTWNGKNHDIVIGITAPLVAYRATLGGSGMRRSITLWNILGIVVLLNTVRVGLLSAPTPFQAYYTNPSNFFVGTMPGVWLPAFLVPVAIFLHVISLKLLAAGSHQD